MADETYMAALSRFLRGGDKPPENPAGRTTADAFRQRQEDMDAVNAELARQNRKPQQPAPVPPNMTGTRG